MPVALTLLSLVLGVVLSFGGVAAAHDVETHRDRADRAAEAGAPALDGAGDEAGGFLAEVARRLADRRLDLAERVRIAGVRQQWLAELMERDPGAVLRHALTAGERAALAPEVRALVEDEESHEGALEVLHADGPGGGAYLYGLRTPSGRRLALHFALDGPKLLTGTPVRVRGVRVQEAMAVGGSGSVSVLGLPILPSTLGEHKVLVIMLRFSDTPAGVGQTATQVQAVMFGSGTSATSYFREVSYQQTWLSGAVIGPLSIAMTGAGCDYSRIAALAEQAAAKVPGVSLGQYQHLVYAFPNSTCGWWGLGSIGGYPGRVWINGGVQPMVGVHELGHNLGLYHSHALECGSATFGSSCTSLDYGDTLDAMGGGSGPHHFNAVQKHRLGWLDYGVSPPITEVATSGTYAIAPLETTGTAPKALRIQTALGDWYYVEYRRPIGFDAGIAGNANLAGGVVVHYWDGGPDGIYLLDMTPATASWTDPALAVGATFQDAAGRVSITPAWVDGTTAGVSVTVGSACARAAPTVTLAPAYLEGTAGATLAYTVSVRNNGAGCGASTFALAASVPVGWTATLDAPSLALDEGATGTTTLRVTSGGTAAAGNHAVTVTTAEAGLTGAGTATYAVTASGGGTPGTPGALSDGFDRADAPALGNGWSVVAGAIRIAAGEARNDLLKTLHVAVQPSLAGAAQTVSARFASTNNNVGPRLGVVLRYRDAKNYYACYRMAGGSSMLRIAKVVNGVETVLKSVSIGNPALNAFFTLSCQASGTGLTLSLDGVLKVTATDAAFATGSVGFAMGGPTGGAASHRADNFSATVQ